MAAQNDLRGFLAPVGKAGNLTLCVGVRDPRRNLRLRYCTIYLQFAQENCQSFTSTTSSSSGRFYTKKGLLTVCCQGSGDVAKERPHNLPSPARGKNLRLSPCNNNTTSVGQKVEVSLLRTTVKNRR